MAARKSLTTREGVLVLLAVLAFGAFAILAIDHPTVEPPFILFLSTVGLSVLLRLAAFPPQAGLLLERRDSISGACGSSIALALVLWCPWGPVHSIRGFLMMPVVMLVYILTSAGLGRRDAVLPKH